MLDMVLLGFKFRFFSLIPWMWYLQLHLFGFSFTFSRFKMGLKHPQIPIRIWNGLMVFHGTNKLDLANNTCTKRDSATKENKDVLQLVYLSISKVLLILQCHQVNIFSWEKWYILVTKISIRLPINMMRSLNNAQTFPLYALHYTKSIAKCTIGCAPNSTHQTTKCMSTIYNCFE